MTEGEVGVTSVGAPTDHDSPVRVLHVEDDTAFGELTATFLEAAGLDVTTTDGAEAGLKLLDREAFDCIVSDYEMPGPDGIEFLETVRERHPDVPFILFTGKGSEEIASRAISAGVDDYLQKESGTDQYTVLANRVANYAETAAVERQRRQLLSAIETAQEGIAILDAAGEFVYANHGFTDLYGLDPGELRGQSWERLYPAVSGSKAGEIRESLEATGGWFGDCSSHTAGGERFIGRYAVSVAETGDYVCTVRDVTEHREREQDLRRYERLVETMGDAVASLDMDGYLTAVNRRMVELTGYGRDELVGSHASLYLDSEDVRLAERVIHELLTDESTAPGRYSVTVRRADGADVPVEIRQTAVPGRDGRVHGTVGTLRELHEDNRTTE